MCSRDDDPTQHDIPIPPIDWQARIDEAIYDVRAMAEALVFARSEILRLNKELDNRIDTDLVQEIKRLKEIEGCARRVAEIEAAYTEELHWAMFFLRGALKIDNVPTHPIKPDRRYVLP
jgi:hypothetical protein